MAGNPTETLAGWGYGFNYNYRWYDFYYYRAIPVETSNLFTPEGDVSYYGLKVTVSL